MRYLSLFLLVLITSVIFLMPAWISWIPKTSWPIQIKRITIGAMAAISTLFTTIVIARPNAHVPTRIIGSSVAILYLIIVFVTVYYSWRR
jgi:membrane associated rhomboid family serine protease